VSSLIARVVVNITLYIGILYSLTLIEAGHNEPGGGFIAGAMAASAISLLYLVYGKEFVESRFRIDYRSVMGVGLGIALGFAFLPLLFGEAFLTGLAYTIDVSWIVDLPFVGPVELLDEVHLSSAVGFDIGVYLAVVGAILTILRQGAGGGIDS
jgi:multisubunit Na+/H+ antiporter MnhB subunit